MRPVSISPKDVIDVDSHVYEPKSANQTPWLPELGLSTSDRDVLHSPIGWLNDSLINAAQRLLKEVNPAMPGLQDVTLGLTWNFCVEPHEFIQILHTGRGHWLVVSTIGVQHPVVQVFDSLYTTASTTLKKQIATFLTTMKPSITLHFMDVQMQSGGSDCGLFAIAFATALVDGKKPGKFLFQQGGMRAHLCKCLELGKMTPFPIIRNRCTPSKIKAAEQFNVYCICCMPEIANSTWVQCTACKEWFHSDTCVSIAAEQRCNRKLPWYCSKQCT